MTRTLLTLWCAAVAVVALSGCESTVDAAKKIAAKGTAAFSQRGIAVTRTDKQIAILDSTVLHDQNGAAVVIDLRYRGRQPIIGAPIAINVRDRRGASVFRNDTAGLESALAHLPLLTPGESFTWINDQVQASGTPSNVIAKIGPGQPAPATPPRIQITGVKLSTDPVSGVEASGTVHNLSKVDQLHLVVFALAKRAGRVVAAGRAILQHLYAGRRATFHAFFIGNPKGASISVSAPPSVLQ
jgi:hypothetical protein